MGRKIDLDELTPRERASLPGRIRAADRPAHLDAWAKAKAARDTALAAADGDPDATAAAKAEWQTTKAALLKAAPAAEEEPTDG